MKFSITYNSRKKTPLHLSVEQTINDLFGPKQLIQDSNITRICSSYDERENLFLNQTRNYDETW